jgi:hypothetical protein
MTKYRFFIHSLFCLLVAISGQQAGAPGGAGSLDAEAQAQFEKWQAKSNSQGAGGSGIPIIEIHPCKPFDLPLVQESASRTIASCKTNICDDGCCRYHTAFLPCDTRNTFKYLSCVCNDRTNNTHLDDRAGGGGGGGVDIGGGGSSVGGITGSQPPQPWPVYPAVGGQQGNPTGIGPGSCANGSPWQEQGMDYQNCAAAADCVGVLKNGGQTCCKRSFCWCGEYDEFEEECVA